MDSKVLKKVYAKVETYRDEMISLQDAAHRHTGARARQRRRGGDEEGRVLQGLAREREDIRPDRPVRLARPDRSLRREAEPRRPHEGKIVGPASLGHGAPRHRPARGSEQVDERPVQGQDRGGQDLRPRRRGQPARDRHAALRGEGAPRAPDRPDVRRRPHPRRGRGDGEQARHPVPPREARQPLPEERLHRRSRRRARRTAR